MTTTEIDESSIRGIKWVGKDLPIQLVQFFARSLQPCGDKHYPDETQIHVDNQRRALYVHYRMKSMYLLDIGAS